MYIFPGLAQPPARYRPPFDKGGQPVGEGDARHLLTILAGPSPYQPYLLRAMAQHRTTVPGRFLRVVTNVGSQVPKPLQHLFTTTGGSLVGGTIDRWSRTIYVVPPPGLRDETRVEYALHECVHLFAHPHVPAAGQCPRVCVGTFQRTCGTGFGEGMTQVVTEDIMDAQGISRYYRDRPYEAFTPVVRAVIGALGLDVLARAYFFGAVQALTTSMEARWGTAWRVVAGETTAGEKDKALARLRRLDAGYHQRLRDLIRSAPKGDFPAPDPSRVLA